jgi:hypothetical protein
MKSMRSNGKNGHMKIVSNIVVTFRYKYVEDMQEKVIGMLLMSRCSYFIRILLDRLESRSFYCKEQELCKTVRADNLWH